MISKGIISNKSFFCTGRLSFYPVWKVIILAEEIEAVMFFWLMGLAMSCFQEDQGAHQATGPHLEGWSPGWSEAGCGTSVL